MTVVHLGFHFTIFHIPVTICARLFPSKPWAHTSFETRVQHKQRTIVQSSGRLGFRRSKQKKLAGVGAVYRCRLSTGGSGGVRRGPRPPLAADRVASWVDMAGCAATRRLPRARTCCSQTLSAVCMAGGAGTDNGPEVESRLVLGLSILRRSSSSSSRPTTSP